MSFVFVGNKEQLCQRNQTHTEMTKNMCQQETATHQANMRMNKAGNKDYGKDMLAKNKVFDKAPDGWKPIEGTTTAPKGYKWYSNGKSMFGGDYEQALVKIGESEEETKDAPKVEEPKFVYQIASNNGTEMLEEDELLKKHKKAGTNLGGRDEIQGKPIFKGLYGPFYNGKTKDGKVIIRYETAGHYNTYD